MSERFPGLGFDPAPGDPDEVRRCSREHARVAVELASLAVEVTREAHVSASWRGAAASAFAARVAPLPVQLRDAADAFFSIARRLSAWAEELEDLRAQARVLEQSASDALDQMRAAHARAVAGPALAPTFGAVLGAAASVPGVAEAQEDLRRAAWRAEELHGRWQAAGRQVAAAVGAAASAAPPVPWSAGEFVWDHREGIESIVDVCSVLAAPALAIPVAGPFLGVGLGVVGTAGAAALAVHADGSTTDVAVGVVGLAVGGAAFGAVRSVRNTPAAGLAVRVGARGVEAADRGLTAVGAALTLGKGDVGSRAPAPAVPPAPYGRSPRRAGPPAPAPVLGRLLVAPVTAPQPAAPGRRRP